MSGLMSLVHTHNSPGKVWSGVAQQPDEVKMKGCGVSVLRSQKPGSSLCPWEISQKHETRGLLGEETTLGRGGRGRGPQPEAT